MDIIHNAIIVIHVLVMLCLLYMSVCLYADTRTVIAMNLAASAIIWPAAYIIPLYVEGVVVVVLFGICMWFKLKYKVSGVCATNVNMGACMQYVNARGRLVRSLYDTFRVISYVYRCSHSWYRYCKVDIR